MNRRKFLAALGIGAASLTFDVEKFLWIPGQKKIFIPERLNSLRYDDILSIELERIRLMIPILFEKESSLSRYLDKKEKEGIEISNRPLRISL